MIHRERYFTERLFWMPDTNELLHVCFVHGAGWFGAEIIDGSSAHRANLRTTYTELMQLYNHRQPELLLQEET